MSSSLVDRLSLYIPTLQEELPTETTTTKVDIVDIDRLIEQQDEVNEIEESSAELAYLNRFARAMDIALRRWELLFQGYYHAKTFGVDRTFVGILNYNNELGQLLSIQFPSVEAMSSVGNPTDALSTKVIAGLEGFIGGFFEWIGEMWTKFWNWVSSIFSSDGPSGSDANNKQYHRLKERIEELLEEIDESEFDAKTWQKVVDKHQNDKLLDIVHVLNQDQKVKDIGPLFIQVIDRLLQGFQGMGDDPKQVVERIGKMDQQIIRDAQNPKFNEFTQAMKDVKKIIPFSAACPNIAGVVKYAKTTCSTMKETSDRGNVFWTDAEVKPIQDKLMAYSKLSQTKFKGVNTGAMDESFIQYCKRMLGGRTPQAVVREFLKANKALMSAIIRYKRFRKMVIGIILKAERQTLAILKTCVNVQ